MKIALVRRRYNPFGGAERFLDQFLDLLLTKGHEVHLFAHEWNVQREIKNSFTFHPVPMMNDPPSLRAWSFAYHAERFLRREKFDLIHSFERMPFLDLYRAGDGCHRAWLDHWGQSDKRFRAGTIFLSPFHQTVLHLERAIFTGKRTRLIVCNSNLVKDEIQKYYGVPETKLRVLHNGVDLNHFHPELRDKFRFQLRKEYGISEEDLVLLFVGSGFERKGLHFLIQSFPTVQDCVKKSLKLLVVGEGSIEGYKNMARYMGCGEKIFFIGPVLDPAHWYGAADLFVLPTLYDPFSNATLEALASGLPVITTRANGASEIMQGEECGVILENPLDTEALASAVLQLSKEKERQKMSKKARDVAMCRSIQEYVEDTIFHYSEILEGNKTPTLSV